jgi:hypothetical protein
MQYTIAFNSVYTPNMCKPICGNHTDDFSTTWENIKGTVKMIEESPKRFYIIGFGFIEIIGSFGHGTTANYIKYKWGIIIPFKRIGFKMRKGWVITTSYDGDRLKEGETELPKNAIIQPMVTLVNL